MIALLQSNSYWQKRADMRMLEYIKTADDNANYISRAYIKASNYINEESKKILETFARDGGMSLSQAKKILANVPDKNEITNLRKLVSKIADPQKRKELQQIIDSPAYAYRIRRFQALQQDIDNKCNQLYNVTTNNTTSLLKDTANRAYNRTMLDIQQGTGLGFNFASMPTSRINEILKNEWSGKHYSKRIWTDTQQLAQSLKEELVTGFLTGRPYHETAKEIEHSMACGSMQARRLVRTESNYVANVSELESYIECDIEKYQFLATLDSRTSLTCQALDGKVYDVDKAQAGVNLPPLHPWCRSTTIAVIDGIVTAGLERRAKDPVTGKTHTVPADMTYKEWEKSLTKEDDSGIIDTKGVKDLQQAKKRDHKIAITDIAIEKVGQVKLSDFSDEQNTLLQQKHKDLLRISQTQNDNNEVLKICDIAFKSEVNINGDEFVVNPNNNPFAVSIVTNAKEKSLAFLHNHPSTNIFSIGDIDTFVVERSIKFLSVVTNQGEVCILNKTKDYSYNKVRNILNEIYNSFGDSDIDNAEFTKMFLKQCHKGGIEYVN